MKHHDPPAVKDRKMSDKAQRLLKILGLSAVLLASGLLLIIGLQSRLPRFSYQPTEPLILAVGTSDSKDDDGGSIWLIQVTEDGPVARHELATPAPRNDATEHTGFFLIECPSLPATVCGYERLEGTANRQIVKIHQWQVVWPLGESVGIQHEEHVIAIPAPAQVTGVVQEGLLFQSKSDLTIHFLRFSDQSVTTVAGTGECSEERIEQRLISKLSPNSNSLAYMCVSPLLPFSQGHSMSSPSDQYLAVVDLNTGSERHLPPETPYFYDGACNLFVVSAFPPYCKYLPLAWSSDGIQVAFVTALTAPVELPGTKSPDHPGWWIPDYQDSGAIYSVALDGTQWHKWIMTEGQTPYMDWSPDNQYLAYGLSNLNIASFAGGNWKIRDTNLIQGLDWSPDGSYIAVRYFMSGAEIVGTSDYTWQSVEVPGQVANMLWLTPPAP